MKEYRVGDEILESVKNIHMIGIGGSGMCPLAEILHTKGYIITGSDNNESDPLKRIIALGIKVYMGHSAANVEGAQLVVYSAAISADNPEIAEAKRLGIPTIERSILLGIITRKFDNVIGVCGTHGKTTVTSMITQVLCISGLDPTAVIGGRLPLIGANGIAGESENMVVESCEFVETFLKLSPDRAVLLNIDNDHLDYYKTMENLTAAFSKFVGMASKIYINGDDALRLTAARNKKGEITTFGINESNDFYATDIKTDTCGISFTVWHKGENMGTAQLSLFGKHNVYNALAAFSVCFDMGISLEEFCEALSSFNGAGRRFEKLFANDEITVMDDYAHHPTEIAATLTAAKELGQNRVTVVFQPFTFSRTELLLDDFISALSIADRVVLTPIMGSREINTSGIDSKDIAKGLKDVKLVDNFEQAADFIVNTKQKGDLV
ncbi:MAG: UDP-N-acetylmuramate--L-alanine ligase, partial [Oscillospiraceae bacterium]|nr:UDP-N-acetylmuramate--L-alanine ligase [Candidatus Equicaccousia limihippi]